MVFINIDINVVIMLVNVLFVGFIFCVLGLFFYIRNKINVVIVNWIIINGSWIIINEVKKVLIIVFKEKYFSIF